ncbi:7,8-dihydro-8-oxoguanine triphosphatase [Pullulanibacillus camelliae]|uniref:7,8-dihydro-8-oxoguanine triphosphatase n=1 Tax=Pullulanibacillus camelliae TaxID=1707096 RepID=A0A8J2VN46_9BACL|nr:8-oxo-dGTP diphosphatase [Pullulanibacillus camelliae]GGE39719.1 7,8-dihydro-8-oxoguanine triphosphatase [Pullulanibacillus camelliae]
MNLAYTICFLRRGEDVLMLNRLKSPEMGVWNGVGGKLESGETPKACALREIQEETGIRLIDVQEKGIVTWNNEGGMYVFIATLPLNFTYETPKATNEGILDWKSISWLIDTQNGGVAEHIKQALTLFFNDPKSYEHRCYFNDKGQLETFTRIPLQTHSHIE